MSYSSKAIANLFIDVARDRGSYVDQMKLQKLVYITHGFNLAIRGEPLISDEIQAWQYGPVIPVLYNEFKNCGRSRIEDYATSHHINTSDFTFSFKPEVVSRDDEDVVLLANKVWAKYGHLSGPQLSDLTHRDSTPWSAAYTLSPRSNISNEAIKNHFIGLLQG